MWKKSESDDPASVRVPEQPAVPRSQPAEPRRPASQGERAVIGPSIIISGDISGDEDLFIQGRVEGRIELAQHSITVGANGRVKADTHGRTVTIEGEVEGDIQAEERIILRPTARVRGNMVAPRVALEDGAKFQGTIDMDVEAPKPERPVATSSAARSVARPGSGGGDDDKNGTSEKAASAPSASSAPGSAGGGSSKGTGSKG
jgi:cytoskeletal protein CcmA (bactofilin family)